MSDAPPTVAEATAFLVEQIAALRHRSPTDIDPAMPFNTLGIDSLDAVSLVGDIETRFHLSIDPVEIFDHPTPQFLARAIVNRMNRHDE